MFSLNKASVAGARGGQEPRLASEVSTRPTPSLRHHRVGFGFGSRHNEKLPGEFS